MYKKLKTNISSLPAIEPSETRRKFLVELRDYIQQGIKNKEVHIQLNFICTHNSRRSHLAQIWAQSMASYYGLEQIRCYSGGTEATAVYPQVLKTLESSGFEMEKIEEGKNPVYAVDIENEGEPIIAFSKSFDDPFNPEHHFAAIMVCDQAYESCPVVKGAEKIISLSYKDPKAYDQSSEKAQRYAACSELIASEMKWVFSQL